MDLHQVRKLVYICNARLPTEKAHGFQIAKMCEAFAENGLDVTLIHPHRRQENEALSKTNIFDYYGVHRVFRVRTLRNFDVVLLEGFFPTRLFAAVFFTHAMMWGLYAALVARRERADFYYTRDSQIAYWLVRFGLPTVYEAHVVPERAQRWLIRRMAEGLTLWLVVVVTSFIKDGVVKIGVPPEKVAVLPDGVDLSLFQNLPGKEECRLRLGLPLDRPIVGYIGRFVTMDMEKGISELVQAMAQLPSLSSTEPLLLCVGGPMELVPLYLEMARKVGLAAHRLRFVDRVPNLEVPYWIRACDVVTIPWPWTEFSAYFTSPLKLFEYMTAGVPIVSSDLPSIREVLRHEQNGWLVEPGSPQALAQGLLKLLEDRQLAFKLARQARVDVGQYAWVQRAEAILKVCSRVA